MPAKEVPGAICTAPGQVAQCPPSFPACHHHALRRASRYPEETSSQVSLKSTESH